MLACKWVYATLLAALGDQGMSAVPAGYRVLTNFRSHPNQLSLHRRQLMDPLSCLASDVGLC